MKYSKTAIGLLTAQYRSVLKKCLLINLGLFALGAVATATPANATDYGTVFAFEGQTQSITDEVINIAAPAWGIYAAGDSATSANPGVANIGGASTKTITVTGTSNPIVYTRSQGTINMEATDKITISTTGTGDQQYPVIAANITTPTDAKNGYATINIKSKEVEISGPTYGVLAMSEGRVNIEGNTTITADKAILSRGNSEININKDNDNFKTVINGDIVLDYDKDTSGTPINTTINANLNGTGSSWTGNTYVSWDTKPDDEKLKIENVSVALNDGATWNATKIDSNDVVSNGLIYRAVNNLNVDGGKVNATENGAQLQVDNLKVGANGVTVTKDAGVTDSAVLTANKSLDLRNGVTDDYASSLAAADGNTKIYVDADSAGNLDQVGGTAKTLAGIQLADLADNQNLNTSGYTVSDAAKASLGAYYGSVTQSGDTLTLGSKAGYADLIGILQNGNYIKAYDAADAANTSVAANLVALDTQVKTNEDAISANTASIATNTDNIATNTAAIADNAAAIALKANSADVYTKTEADGLLGAKLDSTTAASTYETQAHASSTYATQTALATKADAAVLGDGFSATDTVRSAIDAKQDTLVSGTNIKTVAGNSVLGSGNITLADMGAQAVITDTNMLDADLVDDTNSTNKFVTAADKTAWNGKASLTDVGAAGYAKIAKTPTLHQFTISNELTGDDAVSSTFYDKYAVDTTFVKVSSQSGVKALDVTNSAATFTVTGDGDTNGYYNQFKVDADGNGIKLKAEDTNTNNASALYVKGDGVYYNKGGSTATLPANEVVTIGTAKDGIYTPATDTDPAVTIAQAIDSKLTGVAATAVASGDTGFTTGDQVAGAISTAAANYVTSVATGTTNGTIKVTKNGTDTEVAVAGLGTAAYTAADDYATAAQGALADTAVQSVKTVAGVDMVGTGEALTDAQIAALGSGITAATVTALGTPASGGTAATGLFGTVASHTETIADHTATLATHTTDISTNAGNIATNTTAIQTLNGNSTVAGSVDKKILDQAAGATYDADHTIAEAIDTKYNYGSIVKGATEAAPTASTAVYSKAATDEAIATAGTAIRNEATAAWDHAEGWLNTALGIDSLHNDANAALQAALGETNYLSNATSFSAAIKTLDGQAKTNANGILANTNRFEDGATLGSKLTVAESVQARINNGNGTVDADTKVYSTDVTDQMIATASQAIRDEATAAYDHAHSWAEYVTGLDVDENKETQLQTALNGLSSDTDPNNIEATSFAGALHELDSEKLAITSTTAAGASMDLDNSDAMFSAIGSGGDYYNRLAVSSDGNGIVLNARPTGIVGAGTTFEVTSDGVFYNDEEVATDADLALKADLTNPNQTITSKAYKAGDWKLSQSTTGSFMLSKTGATGAVIFDKDLTAQAYKFGDSTFQSKASIVTEGNLRANGQLTLGYDTDDQAVLTGAKINAYDAAVADLPNKYNWGNITGATATETAGAETVTADTHVYSVDATDQKISAASQAIIDQANAAWAHGQEWANKEFGYDTDTTDAPTVLGDAGFEADAAGKLGFSQAIIQNRSLFEDELNPDQEPTGKKLSVVDSIQKALSDPEQDIVADSVTANTAAIGEAVVGSLEFSGQTAVTPITGSSGNSSAHVTAGPTAGIPVLDTQGLDSVMATTATVYDTVNNVLVFAGQTFADKQAWLDAFTGLDSSKSNEESFREEFSSDTNLWVGDGSGANPTSLAGVLHNINSAFGTIHGLVTDTGDDKKVNDDSSIFKDGSITSAIVGVDEEIATALRAGTSVSELQVDLDNAVGNIRAGNTIVGKAYADQNGDIIDETYAKLNEDATFDNLKANSLNINDKMVVTEDGNIATDGTLSANGLASLQGGINVNNKMVVDADGNLGAETLTTAGDANIGGDASVGGNVMAGESVATPKLVLNGKELTNVKTDAITAAGKANVIASTSAVAATVKEMAEKANYTPDASAVNTASATTINEAILANDLVSSANKALLGELTVTENWANIESLENTDGSAPATVVKAIQNVGNYIDNMGDDFVKTTGDQSVAGVKNFTDGITTASLSIGGSAAITGVDAAPTDGSNNLLSSGTIYTALEGKQAVIDANNTLDGAFLTDGTVSLDKLATTDLSQYDNSNSKFVAEGADVSVFNNDAGYQTADDVETALTPYAKTADLAAVATSGDYNDLINTPTFAAVATSGDFADLTVADGSITTRMIKNGAVTKAKLAQGVKDSLALADSALQVTDIATTIRDASSAENDVIVSERAIANALEDKLDSDALDGYNIKDANTDEFSIDNNNVLSLSNSVKNTLAKAETAVQGDDILTSYTESPADGKIYDAKTVNGQLALKANDADLAAVAKSGDFADLTVADGAIALSKLASIDLNDYDNSVAKFVNEAALNTALADYLTSADAANTYATIASLNDYAKLGQDAVFAGLTATSFKMGDVTVSKISNGDAVTEQPNNNDTLATTTTVYKTAKALADSAIDGYKIKDADANEFNIDVDGKLSVKKIAMEKVDGLGDALDLKADKTALDLKADKSTIGDLGSYATVTAYVDAGDAALGQEIAATNQTLATTNTNLSNLNTAVTEGFAALNTEIGNTNAALAQTNQNVADNKAAIDDINGLIGDTSGWTGQDTIAGKIDANEAAIDGLDGRMEDAESRITDAEGRIGAAETRIGTAETRIGEAEGRIGAAETRIGAAEADIADLKVEAAKIGDLQYLNDDAKNVDGSIPGNLVVAMNNMDKNLNDKIDGLVDDIDAADHNWTGENTFQKEVTFKNGIHVDGVAEIDEVKADKVSTDELVLNEKSVKYIDDGTNTTAVEAGKTDTLATTATVLKSSQMGEFTSEGAESLGDAATIKDAINALGNAVDEANDKIGDVDFSDGINIADTTTDLTSAAQQLDAAIGEREYTNENVVESGEAIAKSIDKLDTAIGDLEDMDADYIDGAADLATAIQNVATKAQEADGDLEFTGDFTKDADGNDPTNLTDAINNVAANAKEASEGALAEAKKYTDDRLSGEYVNDAGETITDMVIGDKATSILIGASQDDDGETEILAGIGINTKQGEREIEIAAKEGDATVGADFDVADEAIMIAASNDDTEKTTGIEIDNKAGKVTIQAEDSDLDTATGLEIDNDNQTIALVSEDLDNGIATGLTVDNNNQKVTLGTATDDGSEETFYGVEVDAKNKTTTIGDGENEVTIDETGGVTTTGDVTVGDEQVVLSAEDGSITAKGDAKIGDKFSVTAEDGSMSAAGGNFTVDGDGNTAIAGTADIEGDTTIGDKFSVTAEDGSMSAAGGNFTVDGDGNTAVAGTADIEGDTTIGDKFSVTAEDGSMSAAGGNFTVDKDGNTAVAGTLNVTGATELADTLDVAGKTTLSSDNGMAFSAKPDVVVKSIDDGSTPVTGDGDPEALATTATVMTSAENAKYTGGNSTQGATYATVGADTIKGAFEAIEKFVGPNEAMEHNAIAADTNTSVTEALNNLATNVNNGMGGEFADDGSWSASMNNDKPADYRDLSGESLADAVEAINSNIGKADNLQGYNGVEAGKSVNDNIAAVNATIGDLSGLNTELKNLTNGDGPKPEDVVTAFNNIDATLGRIHGLAAELEKKGEYQGNLAKGTTVEDHLTALDKSIGNRKNYNNGAGSNGYTATAGADVASALTEIASNIGTAADLVEEGLNGVYSSNTVNSNIAAVNQSLGNIDDLKNAVYAQGGSVTEAIGNVDNKLVNLDYRMNRAEHDLKETHHELRRGMASMAAMSALVPNSRSTGNTTLSIGTGAYSGHNAVAVGAFHYITDNLMLNAGVAWGDSRDAVYRVGMSYSF